MHAHRAFLASTIVAIAALSGCGGGSSTSPNPGFKDPRDGQTYDLVKIGTQTWFAENLDYKGTGSDTVGVCSEFLTANCDLYGRLYTWAEAMGVATSYNNNTLNATGRVQGLCPAGSHLPSDSEWVVLDSAVHGNAADLKSNRWNGNNSTGFGVLPGSSRQNTGDFNAPGQDAYFWYPTEASSSNADFHYFLATSSALLRASYYKTSALSVRCLVN
jgi:uncharacterized protein (TIGR02145 family)